MRAAESVRRLGLARSSGEVRSEAWPTLEAKRGECLRKHLPLLVVLVGPLLIAGDGLALTGDLRNDPADVVRKYLSLDVKGARLEALAWETLRPYINWDEEPVWGQAVVVSSYEVIDDVNRWGVISMLDVLIPVQFQVLGSFYWEIPSFLVEPHVEEVLFRVKAIGDRWRIVEPIIPPHVGQRRMVYYLRQAMLEETDPSRLAKLARLQDEVKEAQ